MSFGSFLVGVVVLAGMLAWPFYYPSATSITVAALVAVAFLIGVFTE